MKSVYNILREQISQNFRKDVTRAYTTDAFNKTVEENCWVKYTVSNSSRKSYKQQVFFYKPSYMNSGIRNLGCRQFSTMVDRMEKFADPKNDFVFKKLFGSENNKDLLIDFINKVLPDKHVKEIEYIPTNLEPDIRTKKQSILDVLCTDENNSKYIIEMQNAKEKGFEKRAVYYASKTYSAQLDKSNKYSDLKEVIFVAITNFVMFPNKIEYISTHSILDNKTYHHDLKDFSFVFIELPKFTKQDGIEGVDTWCDLFKNASNRKTVDTSDPIIKKAYETLEMTNWTEQELLDFHAYEKIERDNQAREDQVRDEGKNEGKNEKAIEIAKNLKDSKVDISIISKTTGLSEDQIKDL